MARLFARLRKRRLRARAADPAPPVATRGLGEPPAAAGADDAELDTLRGELVRELDRIAAESGDGSGFRRS